MKKMKSVCVIDFCGYAKPGHFPVSYRADYEEGLVKFGGDWADVPDWVVDHEPTEQEVFTHLRTPKIRKFSHI